MTVEHFITIKETFVAGNMKIQLQTSRLMLQGLTKSDAEDLYRYRSLPEVTRFQGWAPASVEEAVRFVEEDICHEINQPDTWFQFGIFLREDQTLIGDLGIHFLPDLSDEAEIGVTVAPGYQSKGFASEAVSRVLEFLFHTLHKNKVTASVDPENRKSMALMERIGFKLEGIHKKTILFRGEWTDDAVFSLTRKQWENRPKPNL